MLVFLIVILLLAALLEILSLRGGAERVDLDFTLNRTRSEPDEPIEVTTTAANGGRLPITYLTVSLGFPLCAEMPAGVTAVRDPQRCTVTDLLRLWGRQRVSRTMTFRITQRGVYSIVGRELTRGDFLGLRAQSRRLDLRRGVLIYPRRLENAALTEALGNYCGELSARRWLLRDPVLTLGVREYTGSEPMHTISWNQTARRGELTVREFDYTRSMDCSVILCVDHIAVQDTELMDRCCGAARTVCETLIEHGAAAHLFTNAALIGYGLAPYRTVTAAPGREEDLLDVLARATAMAVSPAAELVQRCLEAHTETAAYVLIAPRGDEETREALEKLEARSAGAMLIDVSALGGDGP